ncbi:MAG: sigma-70 family RNA polymerase sigma factor, partial [Bacteroidota bacterium]
MASEAPQMPSRGWCILENDCGFDNIVANNQGWLLRYVKKIVGNEAAAEDIVQETFIRAYKAYDGYQETGRLRQWLRTIARNVALRYLGSSAAIREVNLCTSDENFVHFMETAMDPVPSAEDVALANELTRRIMEAISKLPEAQRSVVYYRFVRDFSVHQVAYLTDQPVGSVKSRCHYGLQKLRRLMSQYMIEGEFVVNCKDAYVFLFQYATGRIMPEDRQKVEGHLAACKDCNSMAESLRILAANMTPAQDGEIRHYLIAIPLSDGTTLN